MTYTKTTNEAVPIYYRSYNGSATYDRSKVLSLTGTRTGTKVQDYKEKIARGENASSPFSLDRTFLKESLSSPSSLTRTDTSGRFPVTETFDGHIWADVGISTPPAHLSVSSAKADAIALTKTYKKLDSEISRLNSPAVIAEFMDVLRQFGKPADALIDLTNRHLNRLELAKRGLKGSVSFRKIKWHEIVASTYLEWSFGLKPLISDTEAIAEAFGQFKYEASGESPKLRSKIVSRGLDSAATQDYYSITPAQGGYLRFQPMMTTKTEVGVQYVCGLQGSIQADFGSNERLLQLLGFDHGNWIPAAWEVVPWSWLLDYFANVNNILEAAVTSTARVAWVCRTETRTTSKRYTAPPRPSTVPGFYLLKEVEHGPHSGGKLELVRKTVTRTVPQSLGVPPLHFKHPFDKAGKIANMAAVLFARRPSASALWLT